MADIGKIYSAPDADSQFGAVNESVNFKSSDLINLLNETTEYLMFRVINSQPQILDNNRNPLYPDGLIISNSDVFTVFSISLITELLADGNEALTYFENRQSVFTLTNGNYTLEQGQICPPYCP